MAGFTPQLPYNTPMYLLVPVYKQIKGVKKKVYSKEPGELLFYASFKTYGGTERESNGIYMVEDTANIETWYRPEIKADCRVVNALTGAVYEVIGEPENINMQNPFLKFKARRVKGGA